MDFFLRSVGSVDAWVKNNTELVLVVCIIALINYVFYIRSPRYVERTMARRQERQNIGQVLSDALSDAVADDKITHQQMTKYNKKLGIALGLTDMVPMLPTARLWSKVRPDLNKTKLACIRRLDQMGVDIKEGLKKIKLSRPSKKDRMQMKRKST